MKVEIIAVTDLESNPKDEYIYGSIRYLEIRRNMAFLSYTTDTKYRRTSLINHISLMDNVMIITTCNSKYYLKLLEV